MNVPRHHSDGEHHQIDRQLHLFAVRQQVFRLDNEREFVVLRTFDGRRLVSGIPQEQDPALGGLLVVLLVTFAVGTDILVELEDVRAGETLTDLVGGL